MFLDCSPNVLGPATSAVKRCSKCGEFKPSTNEYFPLASNGKLQSRCKTCTCIEAKLWREKYPDRAKASGKAYRDANKERIAAKDKAYRSAWYAKNKERHSASMRSWYEKNKEHHAEYGKAWSAANQDKRNASQHRRRARKQEVGGSFTDADLTAIRAAQTDNQGRLICWRCGKPIKDTPHLDHWIPLDKGGPNSAGNIHYMHAKCNLTKHAKYPTEIGRLI